MNFGEYEVQRDDVELLEEIGSGAFGTVHKGILNRDGNEILCAIKVARNDEQRKNIMDEADLMR